MAVVNQKGGVGKTTVTLGLASAAAAANRRTLVVDLDPQASSTWVLGLDPQSVEMSTSELLQVARAGWARDAVQPSSWGPCVDIIPASSRLQQRESLGPNAVGRLAKALDGLHDDYDLVLIDCAPSLGNLARNALAAASHALVVTEPSSLGLRGIGAVADFIDDVWEGYNPNLELLGVVVNRVPPVSGEADRQYDELNRTVGKRAVWKPVVPQRVVLGQAIAERMPIHSYGSRASDVIAVFDQLYAKLRRTVR